MGTYLPRLPSFLAPPEEKQGHSYAKEEEEARSSRVGDQAADKRSGCGIYRKQSTPVFARGMLLSDEIVRMIQGHENDQQTSKAIEGV
jgi:hypothetical protein